MAKATLPVDFQDDIMSASMNGKRRYNLIQNADGTVSLEDVTNYDQVGNNFGAGQINQTNTAVNESADAGKIVDSLETIQAITQSGYIAGALAVGKLINNLGGIEFVFDSEGKIIGYKTKAGADTVFPFRGAQVISQNLQWVFVENGTTQTKTIDLSNVPGYQYIAADNIFLSFKQSTMGYSGVSITFTQKTYNAKTGILSCSFSVTNDALAQHRNAYITFDLICI